MKANQEMEKREIESQEPSPEGTPRPRKWRGRKKGFQLPPKPAIPVKGLWQQATPEQRETAHRMALAIMEYWLGRIRKEDLAKQLGIPQLRIWQLSQQALSGMVAGLLVQPKVRQTGAQVVVNPEDDPKKLRERIAELEHTVMMQDRLIAIIRELPGVKETDLPPQLRGGKKSETSQEPAKETQTDAKRERKGVRRGRPKKEAKVQPGARHEGGPVARGRANSGEDGG